MNLRDCTAPSPNQGPSHAIPPFPTLCSDRNEVAICAAVGADGFRGDDVASALMREERAAASLFHDERHVLAIRLTWL
ncbi:hypothetical protein RGU70_17515 [Herbaspirillum sp. RTI4]|uniref:hypothetical protein n=1 Tax=Herbaspirillum sp. RTI4 TaxID=3048640 RepID=UPI002AB42DD1|nr:hypothetical protein [Herbaspirillum sp. RTI4]MDY7580111.1 hypothetical protein [Herbaspirillum sp. RTI4]MEA9983630.1 hypothetical protein [Herbaspirillum sp. RTI4]